MKIKATNILLIFIFSFTITSCGGSLMSVRNFGNSLSGIAGKSNEVIYGEFKLCTKKNLLTELTHKLELNGSQKEECRTFIESGKMYHTLSQNLAGIGNSLASLAKKGESDFSFNLSDLSDDLIRYLRIDQLFELTKQTKNITKLLEKRYAKKEIRSIILDSETYITVILGFLEDLSVSYLHNLESFEEKNLLLLEASTKPTDGIEIFKIYKENREYITKRKILLELFKKGIVELSSSHIKLVKEAKNKKSDFNNPAINEEMRNLNFEIQEITVILKQL